MNKEREIVKLVLSLMIFITLSLLLVLDEAFAQQSGGQIIERRRFPIGPGQADLLFEEHQGQRLTFTANLTGNQSGQAGAQNQMQNGGGGTQTSQAGAAPGTASSFPAYMVCRPFNPEYDWWWDWYSGCGWTLQAQGTPSVAPREFALGMLRETSLPQLRIHVNPGLGMVAIPSWFWIEGYDGQAFGPPVGRMEIPAAIGPQVPISSMFPADCECREPTFLTVELRLQPVRFAWSFGDGSVPHLTRSLGPAYPQVSEIRHTYEYSSRFAPGGGFSVQVSALYEAAFRVDGSDWESLGQVVAHPTIVRHEVRDLQTVLVGGDLWDPPASRGR